MHESTLKNDGTSNIYVFARCLPKRKLPEIIRRDPNQYPKLIHKNNAVNTIFCRRIFLTGARHSTLLLLRL